MATQVKTGRSRQAAVYRLFATDGTLLYVGSSYDPNSRCTEVHRNTAWWREVASRTDEWLPSRAAAYEAESAAIKAETPKHNSVGTPRHVEKCRAGYLAHQDKVARRRTQKRPASE